jgi:peptide/nickel transport system permease protein
MSLSAGEVELGAEQISASGAGPEPSAKAIEGRSLGQIAWRRLKHDKVAMVGGFVVVGVIIVAIFAPLFADWYGQSYKQNHQNLLSIDTQLPLGSYGGANGTHWFGITPVLGEDIFAQILYGARTSIIIGFAATALALFFGIALGIVAGFFRGFTDTVISRFMDLLLSFPVLLFSIALLAVTNYIPELQGTIARGGIIIFVLGFFGFPYIGRIVRGQVLSLREKEFVDAARSIGASNWRIMSREIAPNLIGPILVYTTLTIPNYIIGEASLSFLGVGFQPPTVSWGSMLSDANNYFQVDPTYLFAPGLAIFITVLGFNLFGDGLRDALDPRSRR